MRSIHSLEKKKKTKENLLSALVNTKSKLNKKKRNATSLLKIDCKTVGFFFLKISKEIGNAWRKSLMRAKRASLTLT